MKYERRWKLEPIKNGNLKPPYTQLIIATGLTGPIQGGPKLYAVMDRIGQDQASLKGQTGPILQPVLQGFLTGLCYIYSLCSI